MPYNNTFANAQPPRMQTADIRVMLSHFHRQIELAHVRTITQRPKALHYDPNTGALGEFAWPCEPNPKSKTPFDKVIRVAPNNLEAYRRTHLFRAPCCLCSFLDKRGYTESQIAVVEVLSSDEDRNRCLLNGEIVAQCASQRCGYLLCLERFYPLGDLAVRRYSERANPLPVQDLVHISDIEKSFRRGDGLFQVMPDVVARGVHRGLQRLNPSQAREVDPALVRSLEAGVAEDDFWSTFVQCMNCDKVTFRPNFAVNHVCSKTKAHRTHTDGNRFHPYLPSPIRRYNGTSRTTRTPGPRLLARTDTVLVGDQPESQVMRSISSHHASTVSLGSSSSVSSASDSSHNYDPEDVEIYDYDEADTEETNSGLEFTAATAQEDALDSEEGPESVEGDIDHEVRAERSATIQETGLWWEDDVPELSSDDNLPDILALLGEVPPTSTTISDARTQVSAPSSE